jgi:hypothetical protein
MMVWDLFAVVRWPPNCSTAYYPRRQLNWCNALHNAMLGGLLASAQLLTGFLLNTSRTSSLTAQNHPQQKEKYGEISSLI